MLFRSVTGSYDFIKSIQIIDMSQFFMGVMDKSNSLSASFSTRFLNYFSTNLSYKYAEITPTLVYPFINDTITGIAHSFSNHEYGIKLNWAHKETFAYLPPFGLLSNGTNWPVVCANITFGNGTELNSFEYTKLEMQVEKRFRLSEYLKSSVRVTGGNIFGNAPMARLYSAFGADWGNWNLEVPYYFATMRAGEFAASKFVNAFWRTTYYTRLNKPGNFKPEITVSTSAGWGDLSDSFPQNINTYNKGYYESGIILGNLFKASFVKYGVGVHYRYGAYHLPTEKNNWAFTLGLEFGM